MLFLRESRIDAGFGEAKTNPLNLFAETESPPGSLRALLVPLLRSRAFVLVCLLSLGCTIIRETFNTWTPVYLRDYLGYSVSRAAGMSAVFPAVGAASVITVGWLSDRLGVNGRSILMFLGLSATVAALLALMSVHYEYRGRVVAAGRNRRRSRSACWDPTRIWEEHLRLISEESRPPRPPPESSTASATWAA